MSLDPATLRWAYEELPEFPEDDGDRYEYIAGELVVTRFSSIRHQQVLWRLVSPMFRHAEELQAGSPASRPGRSPVRFRRLHGARYGIRPRRTQENRR